MFVTITLTWTVNIVCYAICTNSNNIIYSDIVSTQRSGIVTQTCHGNNSLALDCGMLTLHVGVEDHQYSMQINSTTCQTGIITYAHCGEL